MLQSNCFWSKILLPKTWKISAMRYQFSGILLPNSWSFLDHTCVPLLMVLHVSSGICGSLFSRVRHPNGNFLFFLSPFLLSFLSSNLRRHVWYCYLYLLLSDNSWLVIYVFAVVLFLGACTKPPRLSMITEYMELGSLYYLIHMSGQKKKLSWHRRLRMLRDICRYLSYPA